MVDADISLSQRIQDLAAQSGDLVAYRHVATDGTITPFTWKRLHHRSTRLARALAERGVGVGDRIGIGLPNRPELLLTTLAAWKLGAVPVPVRWDLPDWEHERVRAALDPRILLGESDIPWLDEASTGTATAGEDLPELPDRLAPHMYGICSSGSSGVPKVILSGSPSLYRPRMAQPMIEHWRSVARPQTILVPGPMYHTNAFAMLLYLLAGDRLVVLEAFDAALVLDVVERERITTFTATPTMLRRIADAQDQRPRDLSSLEWVNQGAAPIPPALVHRWIDLIGPQRFMMSYGMTEGLGVTAITGEEWLARPGSVGRGVRGTEIRVLGPDRQALPPGEAGDIHLRTAVLPGFRYLGGAAPPAPTDDGFATVGDVGYLDADGFLFLVDRRTDLIISGGANVFPAEVELALSEHPRIADVVVIGLRDAEWGRRVHAVIEPADPAHPPTLEEVRRFAKSRLAAYKVPKSIEIVTAVPRSAATKVNRTRLVEARGG